MEIRDFLSIASLGFAIFAFLFSMRTNTKRYELKSAYRKEIMAWYSEIIDLLVKLRSQSEGPRVPRQELLDKLSSRIEVGRFYFPNLIKGDKFGHDKPIAYQGYRNLVLDLLVYSYRLFERSDFQKYLKHAETLQRHFTSLVFEILDPRSHLLETRKHTDKMFVKELTFEDFLEREPEIIREYL